jgi:hypothetical protein
MLNQQFFTRATLSKILGFKSVGMLQELEVKGLVKPAIKPSKYTLNQAFFVFICKTIVHETNFTWCFLIDFQFNKLLECDDLYENNMLNYTIFRKYGLINTTVENNDVFCKELENVLKTLYPNQDKILYIINDDNNDVDSIVISLKKLRQNFELKCKELNINLTEKLSA